ncbi:MAG: RNA polymerase sigma factor [Aquihabitans sp.]
MPTRRTAARPSDAAQHEYETTFRTLRPVVARFASARINTDEVDDVVAQTFLTAWRRRADAPVDRDLYRAWLLRITRNEILNHRRSRRRRGALEERMSRQPSDTTTIHLDRPRLRDEVLDHQIVALLDRL